MILSETTQKLFISFIILNIIFSQDCPTLIPDSYGDCSTPLGYIWIGYDCMMISGCDMGDDEEFFFNTFEECDIECSDNISLGDLNNDSMIDVIDIVQLVNIILSDNNSYLEYGDLNYDLLLNINNINH